MGGINVSKPIIRVPIDDKRLEWQYNHLDDYNFFQRIIIEHKYNKAIEKKIKEDYDRVSKKDN